ncbi:RagB/SusD family nutrient uptake outer membrane protein [Autumnicola musiva]|uniref:RagB/SusD family nutrient uptake outer membrane protein n=1 Tax=Autumnicola musiva TaxID=3075589 RepID=A0ABU3D1I3_9FLAO|nr:RagB/SusD family nutrient uptake outer membrane protein [Zunongwangia sp. F117]MDT0675259.1 RagB/SusD family nutrient uptake outer membrane protein [Zunongwangia sp. F117]
MKNIIKIFAASALLAVSACSDDFIENEPYTERVPENFYQTPEDAYEGLVAVYDALQREGYGGFLMSTEIASDNCYGGFGTADNQVALDWDRFEFGSDLEMNEPVWRICYLGIYRANVLLENLDRVDWGENTDLRTTYEAEARFLRAHFHFELARMFGEIVPLESTLTPEEFESPRAPAEETYALIANDFLFAAQNLSDANYSLNSSPNYGRVTKWAAEAYLAKAFLFYTDYYETEDLAGVVNKQQATEYINDVVNNSGHELLPEYGSLWLAAAAADTTITYAGEGNREMVFAIRYNSSGNGEWALNEGNRFTVNIAPRGSNIGPYAYGWGGATVTPDLYNAYQAGDTRRNATIIDFAAEGLDFDPEDRGQRQYTGYAWKKYAPITNEAGEAVVAAGGGDIQIDNFEDYAVIRFSEVLLMAAELNMGTDDAFAQQALDRVRERAFGDDTHDIALTKENIMMERRLELALEGKRYFDLIRWSLEIAEQQIEETDLGGEFNVDFRPETQGWFPLPQSQILLSNGAIEQNPGW